MRTLFYLLAIVSALFFVYSAINLGQHLSATTVLHFDDHNNVNKIMNDPGYDELVKKYEVKIEAFSGQAKKDGNWYFWMSFIVTFLTAASTLLSSIQAAKKDPPPSAHSAKVFAIIIAVMAFCSTMVNFAGTHFNDLKTIAAKKASDLTIMLNQFYAEYDTAPDAGRPAVVTKYQRKLDDYIRISEAGKTFAMNVYDRNTLPLIAITSQKKQ